ncbi:MAG: hypothetical protein ABJB69_01875 [Spartobacteria bacterium]
MTNEQKDRSERTHKAEPNHVPGTNKGEEQALTSKEVGRENGRKNYQDARDSTGINAAQRQPIHPAMPNIPPA